MGLSRLEIINIRNLLPVKVDLSLGINGLYGTNGSGKTSFLEAIYLLGRGASFRSKDLSRVLQNSEQHFTVTAKLAVLGISIGIEYQRQSVLYRIDGQTVRSRGELANLIPLLFISPESHFLISEGPLYRRRFLDWGVFHVEPSFSPGWRRYQRALKQRNKALGMPGIEQAWDNELVSTAEDITLMRRDYLNRLEPYVEEYVQRLVDVGTVTLTFGQGWRLGHDYAEILRESLSQDRAYGFTRQGPHRADVTIKVGGHPAQDTLSRGQQKLLAIALLLAQVALLNKAALVSPVILIDDLAAELDINHRQRLLAVLSELKAQVIFAVTEQHVLPARSEVPIHWFHVEQGRITPSV